MKPLVFTVVIACDGLLLASLVVSWVWPAKRLWPPPEKNSWQFWWIWGLIAILCLGLIALAIIDRDSFILHQWAWSAAGWFLIVLGNLLAWWGVYVLSLSATAGLKHKFVAHGLYRFSRNPQYLGDLALLIGGGLAANSILLWLGVLPAIACCFFAPLVEEPWLREQYGVEYEEYRNRVPRFL